MIVRPAEAETRPQTAVTEVRGRIPVKDASVMEVWGQLGQSADSACARVHTRAKARIRHSGEVRRLQSTVASLGLARISAWAWRGYERLGPDISFRLGNEARMGDPGPSIPSLLT